MPPCARQICSRSKNTWTCSWKFLRQTAPQTKRPKFMNPRTCLDKIKHWFKQYVPLKPTKRDMKKYPPTHPPARVKFAASKWLFKNLCFYPYKTSFLEPKQWWQHQFRQYSSLHDTRPVAVLPNSPAHQRLVPHIFNYDSKTKSAEFTGITLHMDEYDAWWCSLTDTTLS